jgi:hypothetical protein
VSRFCSPAHWSAIERAPFVSRLVPTFVHSLNVFVSFTPLFSLYKKDYVNALLRDDLHLERWDPTASFQSHSGVEEAWVSFIDLASFNILYSYSGVKCHLLPWGIKFHPRKKTIYFSLLSFKQIFLTVFRQNVVHL